MTSTPKTRNHVKKLKTKTCPFFSVPPYFFVSAQYIRRSIPKFSPFYSRETPKPFLSHCSIPPKRSPRGPCIFQQPLRKSWRRCSARGIASPLFATRVSWILRNGDSNVLGMGLTRRVWGGWQARMSRHDVNRILDVRIYIGWATHSCAFRIYGWMQRVI